MPLFQPFQVLMAWAVGVLEVLGLIVFVGYSITYTLHVAHKHLCFAFVFFFFLEKMGLESLWKKLVVWEEWWWTFCAAGNDETLIKPCDFGGGVASGLKQLSAACLQEFLTSYLLTSYQVPTISWVPWQNNKIENQQFSTGMFGWVCRLELDDIWPTSI